MNSRKLLRLVPPESIKPEFIEMAIDLGIDGYVLLKLSDTALSEPNRLSTRHSVPLGEVMALLDQIEAHSSGRDNSPGS